MPVSTFHSKPSTSWNILLLSETFFLYHFDSPDRIFAWVHAKFIAITTLEAK
jgi:hypothetical protein